MAEKMDEAKRRRYKDWLRLADEIASRAHAGQSDKAGAPYIEHPRTVSRLAAELPLPGQLNGMSEEEFRYTVRIAALLHDVCEDSETGEAELEAAGFPPPVLKAVELLTRRPEDSYLQYVERLRPDPVARTVKLADLAHNSDASRLPFLTERDRERLRRYEKARAILLGAEQTEK